MIDGDHALCRAFIAKVDTLLKRHSERSPLCGVERSLTRNSRKERNGKRKEGRKQGREEGSE